MNHVRPIMNTSIRRSLLASRRIQGSTRRAYATEPPNPTPPNPSSSNPSPRPSESPREPSRAGTFYKSFGSPILKCFFGALFTYQVAYWGWLKLETIEEQYDNQNEIKNLKEDLKAAIVARKEQAGGVVEEGKKKVEEKVEKAKKGWWPW